MKVSENTSVAMPIKNMVGIIVAVAMGVFAYTEVTARLTSLETSRELFQADLLKKSEQLPTDQEQFMLIEDLYKTTEKLEITQEQNMTNKVNIEFLKAQLEKTLTDVEKLKDKDLIRHQQTHSKVILQIECLVRNEILKIEREITAGKSSKVNVYINDVQQKLATVLDSNNFINKWLFYTKNF